MRVHGARFAVNYGLDRLRYHHPIGIGQPYFADITMSASQFGDDAAQLTLDFNVFVKGDTEASIEARTIDVYSF